MKRIVLSAILALVAMTTQAAPARRNLLLISIDTLRGDHLSCNGWLGGETPHLDRLAATGANFTRARASVPLTLPSHASILTGNYPPTHTVRDNGSYRLPETQTTLAEVLSAAGFETRAFVGSFVLDRRFGLDQGFRHYDDHAWSDVSMLENLEAERSGEAVYESFAQWLRGRPRETPFFAWIHLYDPHAPYEAPEPFAGRHPDDPYAAEVEYTDSVIGRILGTLASTGLLDASVLAVVGDHGEGLGEHGEATHSLLIYNSTLHVPMILSAPGLIEAGRSIDRLVRTIDLAPTLLDYLGLEPDLGEGTSLKPLIEGKATAPLLAYSESLYPSFHLGWSELIGLEGERHRIVVAPQPELYDVSQDPGETDNLYDSERQAFRNLFRRLEAIEDAFPAEEDSLPAQTVDAETAARLRSLGYLSEAPAGHVGSGADPKLRMSVWQQIQRGMAQFGSDQLDAAAKTFAAVLELEPDVPLLYEYLGSTHMRLEQWSEAEAVYRESLERGIASSRALVDLGLIYQRRRELARAERAFRGAIEIDGNHVEAHHRLGDLLRAAGRSPEAIESYRMALAINPSHVYSWSGLGMAQAATGQDQAALDSLRRAVEIGPTEPLGHFNLAVQLERTGQPREAREEYERFVELSADRADLAAHRDRAAEAARRLGPQQD